MHRSLLFVSLIVLAGAAWIDTGSAHGGSYRGPGDTVPPGGGGGSGGGTPGPIGPSQPGGGTAPTGPRPGAGTPGIPTGGLPGAAGGAATGGPDSGTDLTTWELWWGFNKDQYLNLKAHVHAGLRTGTGDDYFTGLDGAQAARTALKPSEETIRTVVVPALIEALETERANDIVTGALVALGKIGDIRGEDGASPFETLIARFLADPNQEIAETAAIALGILANDASIQRLEDLALDTPNGRKMVGATEVGYRTRAFATYGLGLIGAKAAKNEQRQRIARTLTDIVRSPRSSTRDVHVAALVAFGLVPIDVDPAWVAGGSQDAAACRQAQILFLQRFLADSSQHHLVRAHAPAALARLLAGAPAEMKEAAARALIAPLAVHSKETDQVRMGCVLALGAIGDSDADAIDMEIRDVLRRCAEDADIQSRNFTNIALGQIGGRPGQGADGARGQREAREFLVTQLTKGKNHMRPWAGIGIGVMEHALRKSGVVGGSASATAKDVLRKALSEAVAPDRVGAYAIGLGIAGDEESRELLAEKLARTSESTARGYVAIALGLVGAHASVEDVRVVVRESKYKPELLRSAAIGLGLLGDKELVPELCTLLAEARGLSSQAALASALGFIGDSRSIDPLVAMLRNKTGVTSSGRGFAAVALGIVADKEPLPWNAKISTDIQYRANTTTLTGAGGTGILDIL